MMQFVVTPYSPGINLPLKVFIFVKNKISYKITMESNSTDK